MSLTIPLEEQLPLSIRGRGIEKLYCVIHVPVDDQNVEMSIVIIIQKIRAETYIGECCFSQSYGETLIREESPPSL